MASEMEDEVRSVIPFLRYMQHTSAYDSIRQHTSAYVSIRQHTWPPSTAYSYTCHCLLYMCVRILVYVFPRILHLFVFYYLIKAIINQLAII